MASGAKDIQLRELKDTVSQLKVMVSEQIELIGSLCLMIDEKFSHEEALQEPVDCLIRILFGSSSERRSDDIPGQQNLFDEEEMEQIPFLLEEETMTQELEFIPATCKVIEYYSQSYCCPSCKKGLGDTEKSVIVKFQMRRLWSGRATPRHPLLHGPSTVRRTMYDVIHRELLKCSFAMSDETRA